MDNIALRLYKPALIADIGRLRQGRQHIGTGDTPLLQEAPHTLYVGQPSFCHIGPIHPRDKARPFARHKQVKAGGPAKIAPGVELIKAKAITQRGNESRRGPCAFAAQPTPRIVRTGLA